MKVPHLRSPYDPVGGIVYFPRMLDKIRLQQKGQLPAEYHDNLGTGFDGRCCSFLGIDYAALRQQTEAGGSDETLVEWAFAQGRRPDEEQIEVWNGFMTKRGWKDEGNPQLLKRKRESGFEQRDDIQTFFDYIEADEGRPPRMV